MDHVDRAALKDDMDKLRKELESSQGEEDLHHLNYIVSISNLFTVIGIASLWLPCHFIFPWVFLSTGTFARWTMIAHHTCHGGYDHTSDSRYNRFKFGLGSFQRRFNDWLDWFCWMILLFDHVVDELLSLFVDDPVSLCRLRL